MKTPAENSRQAVDRFLGKLGEPLSPMEVERAIGSVYRRLDEAEALSIPARTPQAATYFRWSPVAAAILVMLIGGAVQLLFLRPDVSGSVAKAVSGQVYFVESYSPLSIASRIAGGQLVRAGLEGGAIALLDGSRIEMSPQAELSIVQASDGMRVRLGSGTVIVTAAKQRNGHLYVETKDLLVSVVGTVFSVSAEAVGSRVSVIEGEVHVQQGQTVHTLLPGQQASTSPALGPLPVETDLGWSKSAGELVALLQQSTPAVPAPVPATVPQTVSRVIQGSVKLASKQEVVSGVTVTACPENTRGYTVGRTLTVNPGVDDVFIVGQAPGDVTDGGKIIRNKTFFFALFDGAAACPNPIQAKTDAAGRFQLQELPPGNYVVRAELEGYFGAVDNGKYPAFASQQVTVDALQPVPEISLSLVRSGSISGRVRDTEGKLMVNAEVSAGVPVPGDGNIAISTSKTTDDRGEYRLFGLPPGEYLVGVGVQGVLSKVETLSGTYLQRYTVKRIAPANGQTFFPNAASVSEATPIVLKEGEEVGGIDIIMRPMLPADAPLQRAPAPVFRR
jgi:hypothetical protein